MGATGRRKRQKRGSHVGLGEEDVRGSRLEGNTRRPTGKGLDG